MMGKERIRVKGKAVEIGKLPTKQEKHVKNCEPFRIPAFCLFQVKEGAGFSVYFYRAMYRTRNLTR